ncbi:hypothetical protein PFISCL1PPCAC_20652, partial [Pristionchus fissidentatus]
TKVLRWEFEGISKMGMDDKLFSPITTIHGLLWHMVVRKDEMPTAEGTYAPFFGCFLVCCEGSDEEAWTVEHESTIVLVNRRNTELNLKQDFSTPFGRRAPASDHSGSLAPRSCWMRRRVSSRTTRSSLRRMSLSSQSRGFARGASSIFRLLLHKATSC